MSKPSSSTPRKSTKDQSAPRIACANVDHSDVVTDVVPLSIVPGHVPTKRRPITPTMKKAKPSSVSKSSNPYGSVQIPSSEIRNIEPSIAVKKPHSMTSLYIDPIKTTDVEPDVVASAKGSIVPIVVDSVESSEKSNSSTVSLDNPRYDKSLGQSSMNIVDKDSVDKNIHVLISKILNVEPKSDVMSDVTTSLGQADHPIETSLEKYDGKSDSESFSIKSPKNSDEKDDFDIMFVDMSDKDRLAPGIAKRLKNRKGKVVESTRKPPKATKTSQSVGPAKGWSKVVTSATKKISIKRKEVPSSSSDSEYDVEQNVQDVMPLKKVVGKKVPANVPEVPIDNISFHSVKNVEE
ncbi:uncharacterized protein LOC127135075 [Lathyrus oleraceus]|uniref:uncharacterized protein LOC127135075 n=1 Tax=Pisum sativum TaxID=3888 RepID=UPI0021CF89E3|nr:uncharacterized protein LOC127135075 [Pisum sativum]